MPPRLAGASGLFARSTPCYGAGMVLVLTCQSAILLTLAVIGVSALQAVGGQVRAQWVVRAIHGALAEEARRRRQLDEVDAVGGRAPRGRAGVVARHHRPACLQCHHVGVGLSADHPELGGECAAVPASPASVYPSFVSSRHIACYSGRAGASPCHTQDCCTRFWAVPVPPFLGTALRPRECHLQSVVCAPHPSCIWMGVC